MYFSLIVPTLGRTLELRALLDSLARQQHANFQVIIVDQNTDDRVDEIVRDFGSGMRITHLRSNILHNSHAKNFGAANAQGDVVAFPDDDCEYPSDMLCRVEAYFQSNKQVSFLTGPSVTAEGKIGSGRWLKKSSDLTQRNIWNALIEFNFFIRRDDFVRAGGFDELIGIGGPFGSAEGQDLALRLLKMGACGRYDSDLRAVHPDKSLTPTAVKRAFTYGAGLGYVLKKNKCPVETVFEFFFRPVGGILLNLLRARPEVARYYARTLRGRVWGYKSFKSYATVRD